MEFKYKYILNLVIFCTGILLADDKAKNETNTFSFTLGLNEYQTKESVLNKVKHRGLFPALFFDYKIPSETDQHNIQFLFLFNQLKSPFENKKATFVTRTDLNYSYSQRVSQLSQQVDFFLGGISGISYNISYFENWDESHFYWLTNYYLGLDGIFKYYHSNGRILSLEVQMPLLSLISRPPERFRKSEINSQFSSILGDIHNNMKLVSINRHFDLRLSLSYVLSKDILFSPILMWHFTYLNNTIPGSKKLKILTHTFGIKLNF